MALHYNTTLSQYPSNFDRVKIALAKKFKLPYMNDQLIYKDKSKGYILKDGSYSKKLMIGSLKKLRIIENKCYQINTINRNVLNTSPLLSSEFICVTNFFL